VAVLTFVYGALLAAWLMVCVWSLYNLPILMAGVRNLRKGRKRVFQSCLPSFSVIVPVKDEEKVIGRFLEAMSRVDYCHDRVEVITVEDGSTDKTSEICREFAESHGDLCVRNLHGQSSNGKPCALNLGLREAKGDIVAVFDADSVPAPDVLLNVCKYFDEPSVAAVQGRTMSINEDQNMLTKFISYEDAVWSEAYLRGKDALDLFVHLRGTCQFIRRSVLAELGNFDEGTLSEDMELSARLTERGYRIRYGSDVCSMQESPAVLKTLLKQRIRWCRGMMEVAFRYGRLMAKPSRKSVDAEATLFAPVILIVSLLTYFAASYLVLAPNNLGLLMSLASRIAFLSMTLTLILSSLALIYSAKPRKISSILWLPFVYSYYTLQTLIAIYAVGLIVLRRPRRWIKTEKTGTIKVNHSINTGG